jgi:Tfp pilus assembly protein PilN
LSSCPLIYDRIFNYDKIKNEISDGNSPRESGNLMNLVWRDQRQECLLARWNLLPLGLEQRGRRESLLALVAVAVAVAALAVHLLLLLSCTVAT